MFGYFSLQAGTEWSFTVKDLEGKYSEEIKEVLEGKHRIGRSRSAEYGLVEISLLEEINSSKEKKFTDEIILYANSNLCFYDQETGQPTALPVAEQLVGKKEATIDWRKSQVRSRNYKTWNRHRANKDTERIIIMRGSVFVIKLNGECSSSFFENGIGAHLNEGFGKVLINPSFLLSDSDKLPFQLKKYNPELKEEFVIEKGEEDQKVLECLEQIKLFNDIDYQVDKRVNEFIAQYKTIFKGISKSQWGVLRNYGKNINKIDHFEKLIFDRNNGFLYTGQSENDWRAKNRRIILKNQLDVLKENASKQYFQFVVKLSNQMAKN